MNQKLRIKKVLKKSVHDTLTPPTGKYINLKFIRENMDVINKDGKEYTIKEIIDIALN